MQILPQKRLQKFNFSKNFQSFNSQKSANDDSVCSVDAESRRKSRVSSKDSDSSKGSEGSSSSESHTPPLPESFNKRKKFSGSDKVDVSKGKEEKAEKKSNEWDMFAEADNIGEFNVSIDRKFHKNIKK